MDLGSARCGFGVCNRCGPVDGGWRSVRRRCTLPKQHLLSADQLSAAIYDSNQVRYCSPISSVFTTHFVSSSSHHKSYHTCFAPLILFPRSLPAQMPVLGQPSLNSARISAKRPQLPQIFDCCRVSGSPKIIFFGCAKTPLSGPESRKYAK